MYLIIMNENNNEELLRVIDNFQLWDDQQKKMEIENKQIP
jgi:hypothetical protein